MNICCVQGGKWKKDNARKICEEYWIIYSEKMSIHNGLRVVMDEEMKVIRKWTGGQEKW